MTTETGEPAPAAQPPPAAESNSQKPAQPQEPKQAGKTEQQAKGGDAAGEKKLSGAELKKKAKEEKAARRAQAKAAQTSQGPAAGGQQSQSGDKGGKGKAKHDGQAGAQQGYQRQAGKPAPAAPKEVKPTVPECFSHLSLAKRVSITQADKDVHPAVLILGQWMNTFQITDSTTRVEATLQAFKKVIESYTTPQGTTFSRHFTSHVLNPQIDYLQACRPMSFAMGNAVRWLKMQISKVDIDLADFEAKKLLCEAIDNYIRDRITIANPMIAEMTNEHIGQTETILTYGHHFLVERALFYAKTCGKNISVVIVDDPYERTGLEFSKRLSRNGFGRVSYCTDLGALRTHLRRVTTILLGAEAMFSNGAMYARAGTCDIAVAAKEAHVKIIAMCETINFTERMAVDSLTYNEIDPERNTGEELRLLFDTTKPEYIKAVVNELGSSTPATVAATLRKLEEL